MWLFDLFADPCETTDIAAEKPEVFEELKQKLSSYWDQLTPQQNKPVDPRSNPILFNNAWSTWLSNPSVHSNEL